VAAVNAFDASSHVRHTVSRLPTQIADVNFVVEVASLSWSVTAMKIKTLVLASALVFSASCGKKDPAEQIVSMMEEVANAADAAGGDCGKMADGMSAVMNKYDLKSLKEEGNKMKADKEASKKLMEKYGPRMEKVMPKLMGLAKCADDPKMKELNAKFKDVM